MDHQNQELESKSRSSSFGRLSGVGSSRRHSFGLLSAPNDDDDDDVIETESVSEAGDIGDRALNSSRASISGRSHFSLDNVVPIRGDDSFHAVIESQAEKNDEKEVPWLLEYVTCLLSLAVFGILGVLARYCLQKLFGPGVIGATSDQNYMYLDLPSNMVGSFLMGWLGVIFKGDISKVSNQLAIGLTTGFLGSLTTFSGWNQKMLDLSAEGEWAFAVLGIFIGFFLVAFSIIFGIETAKGFKGLLVRSNTRINSPRACVSDKSHYLVCFTLTLVIMLGLLWGIFGSFEVKKFRNGGAKPQLFLACLVGPFGVWIRFFLARFNGRGLGKNRALKWMPFGTLAANILASCVMAALATLKKAIRTTNCETVASGVQFGLLGCLSTVSTFIAEFNAMRESNNTWRGYAYATTTFFISFILGTLIYSVPVWARGYD
ncbi:hypothetical protein ABFX02_03G103900 [Erythranthe guttata]